MVKKIFIISCILLVLFFGASPSYSSEKQEISCWTPYMHDLRIQIWSHWLPSRQKLSLRTVVLFNISKNGALNSIKIQQSSGDTEFDLSAIQAVQDAAPFNAFPKEANLEDIDINFTFDCNLVHGSSSNIKADNKHNGYINVLVKEVDEYLKPYYKYPKNKKVVLDLRFIDSNGVTKLCNVILLKSSGNKQFDSQVLAVLRNRNLTFSAIPPNIKKEAIAIKMTISTKPSRKTNIISTFVGACVGFITTLILF